MQENLEKVKVLFVCMGNICRSPTAEGVFLDLLEKKGMANRVEVDSAGTHGYHIGRPADPRTRAAAQARGYDLKSISRKFQDPDDFIYYDFIFVADDQNLADLNDLDLRGKYKNKIYKITDFCTHHEVSEVPDPYYGGAKGFEAVLEIIEDASEGIYKFLQNKGFFN